MSDFSQNFLTLIIVVLGIVTVAMSVGVSIYFKIQYGRIKNSAAKTLTGALHWQLIGEAVIGMGTLVFTIAAHYGWLIDWGIELQSGIRFMMFFATAVTTLHLGSTVWRIMHHRSNRRGS